MNVIIEINGRQAVPVRAIPLLTDWKALSPDQVAQILSGDDLHWQSFEGLTAYHLHPDGSTEQILPRWWASWIVGKLQATSDAIKAQQISHETGYQQWRCESLAQLPAGVFVWRDEFENAHVGEYGPESLRSYMNRETFNPSVYTLDFNPQPPPDIAPQHLVLEGFAPNESESSKKAKQMMEWLNAPREELPQESQDAFARWCEIDAIDQQMKELEVTRPVGVTEILASRAALKELHTERARLLAILEGREPPTPAESPQTATGAEGFASTQTVSDPERRLARLREMGGNAKYRCGEWRITGIVALTGVEKNEGRKRVDQQTIRADIKEAAQSELDAKRAGPFDGVGAR